MLRWFIGCFGSSHLQTGMPGEARKATRSPSKVENKWPCGYRPGSSGKWRWKWKMLGREISWEDYGITRTISLDLQGTRYLIWPWKGSLLLSSRIVVIQHCLAKETTPVMLGCTEGQHQTRGATTRLCQGLCPKWLRLEACELVDIDCSYFSAGKIVAGPCRFQAWSARAEASSALEQHHAFVDVTYITVNI